MKTKLLALILLAAFALSACSAATTPSQSSDASTPASSDAAEASGDSSPAEATGDAAVLNIMVGEQFSAPVSNDLEVFKILQEKTNTILNVTNVAQIDLEVKVQTALSSGSSPDMVEFANYDTAALYAQNGLFLPMDQYLDKYNNIQKWWDAYPSLKKNMHFDDGKLYALPKIDTRVFLNHFSINQDWLDAVNMQQPTDLSEFYETLKAFKQAYPDGTPYGIGQYTSFHTLIEQIMYAYDVQREFRVYDDETFNFGMYSRSESFRQSLSYLATLYREQLIEPQLFSISQDEVTKKVSNGEVGVFVSWEMYELYGPGGSYGTNYVPMAALKGPDGKAHDRGSAPTGVPFYVTKDCKDPEAVMRLYDYIVSDEGVELMNWGIEGDTFEKTDSGNIYTDKILNHEFGPSTGRYALGLCTPHFPCVSLKESEYAAVMPLVQEREKLLAGVQYPDNPVLSGTEEENAIMSKTMVDVNKYVDESLPKFVSGDWNTADDFDAFIAQLKGMGIEEAISIKQVQFERWNNR